MTKSHVPAWVVSLTVEPLAGPGLTSETSDQYD